MRDTFIVIAFLLATAEMFAETNHYVRTGATGNGSDWANACGDFTGSCGVVSLVRGDVYYIAGGNYAARIFNTPAKGQAYITIKKATSADHGTDAGWNSSYGEGQAVWPSITFGSSYWILDGVTGSGTSGYGMKVQQTDCASASKDITISANNITLAHLELPHCGTGSPYDSYKQDVLYAATGSDSITVRHCYFHHVSRTFILTVGATNWLVEHSYFYRRDGTDPRVHGEAISINNSGPNAGWVIRYNTLKDVYGTGFIVIKDSIQGGFSIYGNTFIESERNWWVSNGAITNTNGDTNSNMLVYNNTFVNIGAWGTGSGFVWWDGAGSGNKTYNNLWYRCRPGFGFRGAGNDYNSFYQSGGDGRAYGEAHEKFGRGNPFVDLAGGNFRLSAETAAGIVLSSTSPPGCIPGTNCYNIDADGLPRGADGTWDRGAYEFQRGTPPPTLPAASSSPSTQQRTSGSTRKH